MTERLRRRGPSQALTAYGMLVLTGATMVGFVPILPFVVLGSALQALGGAGLLVAAMSLAESTRALGLITASLAVLGATGPLVGSMVGDLLSWWAALALPALSLPALAFILISATRAPAAAAPGRFDHVGAVLLTALVTSLVFIPHQPIPSLLGALAVATLLARHLRRRSDGFLPAVLISTPAFLLTAGLALGLAVINFGILYAAPTLLTQRGTWTTAQIGLVMLWPYLIGGALSWVVVMMTARLRTRFVILVLAGTGVLAAVTAALSSGHRHW